jgi:tritrans,polycis-undecaprenyl-diphosphate synthase [geranylgeranyl-diphosphate specific]
MLSSIGFIPDGNRRFANEHNVSIIKAYALGTEKAWQTIDWLTEYPSIKSGVFYTLSLKNLARKKHELSLLFGIFEKELKKVTDSDYFERNGIRLKFIGRLGELPERVRGKIADAEEATADYSKKIIYLALGYDGQAEIVDAAKQVALDFRAGRIELQDIDEKSFMSYLYVPKEPEMIIRTSGEQRLSGFLPYQSTYSELYFCEKYWPEFEQSDLAKAVRDYGQRKKNFGK